MQKSKITSLFKRHPEGLTLADIQKLLDVKRTERTKLVASLREMEREGLIRFTRNRYGLAPASGLVRGVFVTTRRGFGFVRRSEGGGEDIFVHARNAEGVIQGDEVEVLVTEKGKFGKPEGRIVRIAKRPRTTLIGIFVERSGAPFLQAFESPSPDDLPLRSKGGFRAKPGMVVEVDRKTMAVAKIFGMPDDPGVDTEVIIRRFGLAADFPEDALAEAGACGLDVSGEALAGRRDFRDWPTVTIDGETAQDFDDAVSVRRLENGNTLLGVHIADVSHYVRPGTALDREAYDRATSVYFPGRTLPMLPERLSNDLCSLRPRVPRLTVSVLMEIDEGGRIVGTDFAPSVIQTVERMTYTSVFKIFEGAKSERRRYSRLVPDFLIMRDLARLLRASRLGRGSLDFDLVEPELVYEEGKLKAVAAAERNEAHRLIEDFMVAANVAVATYFTERGIPAVYRVHDVPAVGDLEKLREILGHFGYSLPEPDKIRATDLARVLEKAKGRPEEKFIGIQVLRAMKIASYSTENVGHYGLAQTDYTHFTSPIRRYPDLVVHRILKAALRREKTAAAGLDETALHSSERERNADAAEQALVEWRIFRLLKERLGDAFSGIIVDIAKAGLVVELDGYFVEGLLPFQALGGDYYRRTSARTLRGRRRGKRYDLGDRIDVILVACDPVLQRMSFVPAPAADVETDADL